MPDALFADPRLAAIYDTFDGDRSDLDAYAGIVAELGARSVLDVGSGTGMFAIRLAADGLAVTAVDPARASLEVARAKPGAASVHWIHGDATTLPAMSVDLATMTGNVAQVFLTGDEWTATLRGIHRALRPGGWLVFESRRPERRIWEEWSRAREPVRREVAGTGVVEQLLDVTDVSLPRVSFRHTYRFAASGDVLASTSTLRFRTLPETERSLAETGFEVAEVRDAPDRPGLEYVVLARRLLPETERPSVADEPTVQ